MVWVLLLLLLLLAVQEEKKSRQHSDRREIVPPIPCKRPTDQTVSLPEPLHISGAAGQDSAAEPLPQPQHSEDKIQKAA